MAIIAVVVTLCSGLLGIVDSISRKLNISRAKAELTVLESSLERYKLYYGDYPWLDSRESKGSHELYTALIGHRGPLGRYRLEDGVGLKGVLLPRKDPLQEEKGPHFIDLTQLSVGIRLADNTCEVVNPQVDLPRTLDLNHTQHIFLDPWGRSYQYHYKFLESPIPSTPDRYRLRSSGSNGEFEALDDWERDDSDDLVIP